jgi:hypothetical protein
MVIKIGCISGLDPYPDYLEMLGPDSMNPDHELWCKLGLPIASLECRSQSGSLFSLLCRSDYPAPLQSDANLRLLVHRLSMASFLSLHASTMSVHESPWLHFEPPNLQNFDFNAGPIQLCTQMRIRVKLPKILFARSERVPSRLADFADLL